MVVVARACAGLPEAAVKIVVRLVGAGKYTASMLLVVQLVWRPYNFSVVS
jgi:hypothetical protein